MTFSPTSERRLTGLHPDLVRVIRRAAEISRVAFLVVEGVRSAERQALLWAQGRTRPGKKVTWVRVSNHQVKADGFGHAVDLAPIGVAGAIDWENLAGFTEIYRAMFAAAAELGVKIRAGSDWDCDGTRHEKGESDDPHFELLAA